MGLPGLHPVSPGLRAPRPRILFNRLKSNQKIASLRLERFIHVLFRAQRQGLVLSPDSASCGAASQKRLPLRRALRAYHSFGLGSRRLIHMKCGAISDLVLLFCRSSSYGKTDGSAPLTGRQPKLDKKPGGDQMPVGFLIQWLDAIRIPPSPIKSGAGVSPAAFWLLCRRGQSNPRRSAEYPEKTLIHRLDAIKSPPRPIGQRIPKPLVLACFWLLFARAKSTPGRGAGSPA